MTSDNCEDSFDLMTALKLSQGSQQFREQTRRIHPKVNLLTLVGPKPGGWSHW